MALSVPREAPLELLWAQPEPSFGSSLGSGFLNFFKASASCAFLTVILRFLANF